jgi:tetratricopeptide (TPR) repeat protein
MQHTFINQLRNLLSEDNFEGVFSILKIFLNTVLPNEQVINDLSLIKGNFIKAEKSFYNNEISREDYILETARVRRAMTMILDEIGTMSFDERKAELILKDFLRENPTIIPSKLAKKGHKDVFYAALILFPTALMCYFVFFYENEKPSKVVEQKPPKEVVKKRLISKTDFDFYVNEANRIRQTVGQDNYTTEDGKARIRKTKIYLDTALMARPDDAITYNSRADCYMILGKLDSAMTDIETSLSYDSYHTYTYATRAQIKALKGDTEGFYKDIEEALIRGHDVWRMRNSLGVIEHRYEKRFIQLLKKFKQYQD